MSVLYLGLLTVFNHCAAGSRLQKDVKMSCYLFSTGCGEVSLHSYPPITGWTQLFR